MKKKIQSFNAFLYFNIYIAYCKHFFENSLQKQSSKSFKSSGGLNYANGIFKKIAYT